MCLVGGRGLGKGKRFWCFGNLKRDLRRSSKHGRADSARSPSRRAVAFHPAGIEFKLEARPFSFLLSGQGFSPLPAIPDAKCISLRRRITRRWQFAKGVGFSPISRTPPLKFCRRFLFSLLVLNSHSLAVGAHGMPSSSERVMRTSSLRSRE